MIYFDLQCSYLGLGSTGYWANSIEWGRLDNSFKTERTIVDIISHLDLSENNFSSQEIDQLSSYLIDKFYLSGSSEGKEYTTPKSINKLIVSLLDPQSGEKICDPCFGLGGTLIEAANHINAKTEKNKTATANEYNSIDIEIVGNEVNTTISDITKIRFKLMGLPVSASFNPDDMLDEYNIPYSSNTTLLIDKRTGAVNSRKENIHQNEYFADVVICDPPFGLKPKNNYIKNLTVNNHRLSLPSNLADSHFLLNAFNQLNDKGRMGIVLPPTILSRDGRDRKILKFLVENDCIDTILKLPENLYSSKNVVPIVLIINKQKKSERKRKILFIEIQ
jgi:type I restriction enzyme M protein